MKTTAIVFFLFLIGASAQAQAEVEKLTVVTTEMTDVHPSDAIETISENAAEVARLYKYGNARVKKALSFTAKKDQAKVV